ncbi:hypothetical protein IT575_10010 [bacterium]|nr:hypothetical protein [bacterium]
MSIKTSVPLFIRAVQTVAVCLLAAALSACAGRPESGSLENLRQTDARQTDARPSDARPGSQPPLAAMLRGLPPIPMDSARGATVLQTLTLTGSQASPRSAGAVNDGSNLSLVAPAGGFEYGMFEFTPPAGTLQALVFTMDVSSPGSAWIAIANYERLAWDFKGPYPTLAGAKAFLNLNNGNYKSPGGRVYGLALAYDSTTASVQQVQLTVDDGQTPSFTVSGTVTNSAGSVALPGVNLSLQPGGHVAQSGIDGSFSFEDIEAGDYTLTPSLTGFTFAPPNRDVTVSNADVSGQNFVGTLQGGGPPFTISGKIMDGDTPLAGVTVMVPFEQLDTVTDAQGNYSFEILNEIEDFRVVPLLSGFSFDPPKAFLTGDHDQTQDFTATAYTIPDTVSYATHMKPLVFEPVCMNCHNSAYTGAERHGAHPDVNWDTYGGTDLTFKQHGNSRAQSGSMPPFGFHATINLTDSQKALFQKWEDGAFQP